MCMCLHKTGAVELHLDVVSHISRPLRQMPRRATYSLDWSHAAGTRPHTSLTGHTEMGLVTHGRHHSCQTL